MTNSAREMIHGVGANDTKLMKRKYSIRQQITAAAFILTLCLTPLGNGSCATTKELAAALQKGLFEEEANHNYAAAIASYQMVVDQFDEQRKFAALALYRLSECQRLLNQTNEAVKGYQRLLSEFKDQTNYTAMGRARLTAIGLEDAVTPASGISKLRLAELRGMPTEERAAAVQQMSGDAALAALLKKMNLDRAELRDNRIKYTDKHPQIVHLKEEIETLTAQIESRTGTVLDLMEQRVGTDGRDYPASGIPKARLSDLQNMPLEQRAIALQQMTANPVLSALLQKMSDAQVELTEKNSDFGPQNSEVLKAKGKIQTLESQIEAQTSMALRLMEQSGGSESSAATNGFIQGASENSDRVEADEIARLERLFKDSPDLLEQVNDVNMNALHQAAQKGQLRVAEFILKKGVNIETATGSEGATTVPPGSTALHIAATFGRKAMTDLLLDHKANPNATDSRGATPLHIAARKGFRTVVETLIAGGAKVASRDRAGQTPLHYTAEAGHNSITVQLLEHGAPIDLTDRSGATALTLAVAYKQAAVLDLLLARKAEVNVLSFSPISLTGPHESASRVYPLHLATMRSQDGMVEKLLNAGARPDVTLSDHPNRDTPLLLAVRANVPCLPCVAALLKHRANPNVKDNENTTPLQIAVSKANEKLVAMLLDAGAQTEVRDARGSTPLLAAPLYKKISVVTNLVAHKAAVNAQDNYGETALHNAVIASQKEIIEFLVSHGADINARDKRGMTPLGWTGNADANFRDDIASFLRAHGALERLANPNSITLRRGSEVPVMLNRATNDANQFTLFELLGIEYQFLSPDPEASPSIRERFDLLAFNNPDHAIHLFFPDLKHASVRHPQPSLTNWQEEAVDIDARLLPDNCQDMPLKWGDEVEIPETDHPLSERWRGFNQKQIEAFKQCLHRTVYVVVKGHTNTVNVGPVVDSANYVSTRQPVYIGPVVRRSNLLLSSSDTTRVHVIRPSTADQPAGEWTLNLSTSPDLWLRDGDVIIVPEKQ
jgi:ankyrin repeat protein